ncbi:MAG: acyltransferase [Alkalibacterium sp.]|nr:acyltransferase [Alkalibacterium sp.]
MKKKIRKLIVTFPVLKRVHNKLANNKYRIDTDNIVDFDDGLLKSSHVEIKGKNNYIKLGKSSKIYECSIDINGDNNVIILGNNVSIVEADLKVWGNGNNLKIDDFTTFNRNCEIKVFEGTTVMIGKDCMISYNVDVRSSDGHPIYDENGSRINKASNVFIGDHVWIGSHVNILKGAAVLKGSIIGSGSLVNKIQTKSNVIIAGRPAKILRSDVTWNRKF